MTLPPKAPPKPRPFPTKAEILAFIHDSTGTVGRREIARAFHITGADRANLREILRDLETDGQVSRDRGKRMSLPGVLPEVTVLILSALGPEGEFLCRPLKEAPPREDGPPQPRIELREDAKGKRDGEPFRIGDRILARLTRVDDTLYIARIIRRLAQGPVRLLGMLTETSDGLRLLPTNRKDFDEYRVDRPDGLVSGTFVEAELLPGRQGTVRSVRVLRSFGSDTDPHFVSQVAIETYGIPNVFSQAALDQAQAAQGVGLAGRVDLRDVPLVTIDGADARDFDDAVYAEPDGDPSNPGGWILLVAIADVAHYVPPGSPLDREAFERGNSVYFPDRVVPMLPEALSNGWCSLVPNEDRGCLCARITLDASGEIKGHKFIRGLMRSFARLTYEQVQAAWDGHPDDTTAPLVEQVINPLFGAWEVLTHARARRGCLELELPETKVLVDDQGRPKAIVPRPHLDSHRLIEDFMIAANVSAAETLERRSEPCMYRIHDQPSPEKARALGEFLADQGLPFQKGTIKHAAQFNGILKRVRGTAQEHMINEMVLRSQAQAEYSPDNIGHFGLALRRYAHFTSPIRRYADLVVHRALLRVLGLGKDGGDTTPNLPLDEIGKHITSTERRAAQAERDSVLRATALYLVDRQGAEFTGRVGGVSRAGLFVTLDETGANGFVPFANMPQDYYVHDAHAHRLVGERTGISFCLGDALVVRLRSVSPVNGRLSFEWVDGGSVGDRKPKPPGRGPKPTGPKRPGAKPKKKSGSKHR